MGVNRGVKRAYEAPFPDVRFKAGAQIMPYLVPSQLRENEQAWAVFEAWDKPFLVAFTDSDPVTRGGEKVFELFLEAPLNVVFNQVAAATPLPLLHSPSPPLRLILSESISSTVSGLNPNISLPLMG